MTNLLASLKCTGENHLIIGVSTVASVRINTILEAGANPILLAEEDADEKHFTTSVKSNIAENKLKVLYKPLSIDSIKTVLTSAGRPEVDHIIDRVFVTLPISQAQLKAQIFQECKKLRIPINISDSPEFCTFTLLSTYTSGDFQMGVTTSGKGCKLASRIKRELTNALPSNIGDICNKIGELRTKIQEEDKLELQNIRNRDHLDSIGEHDDDAVTTSKLNALVEEFNMTQEQKKLQRTRWLSQIVEYFPLNTLGDVSLDDLTAAYHDHKASSEIEEPNAKRQKISEHAPKGSISLVGSGPGSVSLLTIGALHAIHSADLVLADKLVPQQVLDLIPQKRTKLFIARKFPGNAEKAQQELLSLGLEALLRGERVVRLKQGDPYIFGRGGEEFNFFAERGFTPVVLPGITSALAAPVLTNIPATHRDVADQVLICTGTGRRGAVPNLPEFVKSRTTVFLMALHRVVELIPKLVEEKGWDSNLPAAIIERASCPDQRIVRTTLVNVAKAVEACGSRPPGLLVTGYACEVIFKQNSEKPEPWVVEEGCESANGSSLEPFLKLVTSYKKEDLIGESSISQTPPPELIST
ncbi:methionine metabolism [Scheffersomyces xylosifermentans]|uniref:methionine metabolism n=1 Tax=Scheffersomyces xylosifermentans TaxID=1304137 RepID=UPI00315DF2F3